MEGFVQLFLEFALQAVVEFLAEFCTRNQPRRAKPLHPFVTGFLWLAAGAVMGGLSLLLFPKSFIESHPLRMVNLIVTPLAVGLLMALLGSERLKSGEQVVPLDKFSNAAAFALGMAVVRFIWAE